MRLLQWNKRHTGILWNVTNDDKDFAWKSPWTCRTTRRILRACKVTTGEHTMRYRAFYEREKHSTNERVTFSRLCSVYNFQYKQVEKERKKETENICKKRIEFKICILRTSSRRFQQLILTRILGSCKSVKQNLRASSGVYCKKVMRTSLYEREKREESF